MKFNLAPTPSSVRPLITQGPVIVGQKKIYDIPDKAEALRLTQFVDEGCNVVVSMHTAQEQRGHEQYQYVIHGVRTLATVCASASCAFEALAICLQKRDVGRNWKESVVSRVL